MKSRRFQVVLSLAALALVASCEGSPAGNPSPTSATTSTTEAPDVQEYESGPESPIMYGMQVPRGATQLGPLIRYRSNRLISAYTPELRTAEAQRDAEARDKAAEDAADGTPAVPTPTPEDTRPSDDSFKLLEDPPRPDSTISLMRIDGEPTEVVRRMLAQIDALMPASGVITDDLSTYCRSSDRRITSCRLAVRSIIEGDRDIRVTMTVDPGNIRTRTSGPSALTRPVMTLLVEYVGEPRKGQLSEDTGSLDEVEDISDRPEKSGLIWPSMDEDAPRTTELLGGWTAPSTATILLSGHRPSFVNVTTARAIQADLIAEEYVNGRARKAGVITKDVVEDLNEVSTSYTTRTRGGGTARAVYVLSARGNYTALFDTPGTN